MLDEKLVDTMLDMGWRERSKRATQWHRRLYGDSPLTASSVAHWSIADAVFRYTGRDTCLEGALEAMPPEEVRKVFSAVADGDGVTDVSKLLMEGLIQDMSMRTTCTAWFDKGDGRRRVFGEPAEAWSPDDKRVDHLLEALPSWGRQAPSVGSALVDLVEVVSAPEWGAPAQEKENEVRAMQKAEQLMHAILGYELIGKPCNSKGLSVKERAGCYHGKFPLDDCYWLAMASVCTKPNRKKKFSPKSIPGRCSCAPCQRILRVRQRFMFVGPAMRGLFACLIKPESGQGASLERKALELCQDVLPHINALFGCNLDLYALQLLPCVWGKFLRGSARLTNAQVQTGNTSALAKWTEVLQALRMSKPRRQAERIMALETRYIKEFYHGMRRLSLEKEMVGMPRGTKRRLAEEIEWSKKPKSQFILGKADLYTIMDSQAESTDLLKKLDFHLEPSKELHSNSAATCVWQT